MTTSIVALENPASTEPIQACAICHRDYHPDDLSYSSVCEAEYCMHCDWPVPAHLVGGPGRHRIAHSTSLQTAGFRHSAQVPYSTLMLAEPSQVPPQDGVQKSRAQSDTISRQILCSKNAPASIAA